MTDDTTGLADNGPDGIGAQPDSAAVSRRRALGGAMLAGLGGAALGAVGEASPGTR